MAHSRGTTISARAEDMEAQRVWYVMDATDKPLGRLAVDAAKILRGKHKPIFTKHVDTGDHVIIINADRVVLTGATKPREPVYHHTGWPGALKSIKRQDELDNRPEEAIRRVVRGMIPHNRLGDATIKKLKVYAGSTHPHEAQQPVIFTGGVQAKSYNEAMPQSRHITLDHIQSSKKETKEMTELVVESENQPEYRCLNLAVLLPTKDKKYLAGSIFPDHYALWWTTGLETVDAFVTEAQKFINELHSNSDVTVALPKQFEGISLYQTEDLTPIEVASSFTQENLRLLTQNHLQKLADGHPQMLRIATAWGDLTYDFISYKGLPRRVTVTSHIANQQALSGLIHRTNATRMVSFEAIKKAITTSLNTFNPVAPLDAHKAGHQTWKEID